MHRATGGVRAQPATACRVRVVAMAMQTQRWPRHQLRHLYLDSTIPGAGSTWTVAPPSGEELALSLSVQLEHLHRAMP
jgi:hypothetical protein